MPEEPRREYVTLGKKSYAMLTRLDRERFHRVADMVKESMGDIDDRLEQEERLVLTCFSLAFSLHSACEKLRIELEPDTDRTR